MKVISWFYKHDDHFVRLINRCQGCSIYYAQFLLWILSYGSLLFVQLTSAFQDAPLLQISLTCFASFVGFQTLWTLWFSHGIKVTLSRKDERPQEARECEKCRLNNKSEHDHHCGLCNQCIRGMDHHCLFINNCVGTANHKQFLGFLLYSLLSALLFLLYDGY